MKPPHTLRHHELGRTGPCPHGAGTRHFVLPCPRKTSGEGRWLFGNLKLYIGWLRHPLLLLMLHFPTLYSFIWEGCVFSEGVNIAPFAANPDTPAAHKHTVLLSNTWQNPCQVVSVPFDVSQKHCHFHLWHCFQHFGCQCS